MYVDECLNYVFSICVDVGKDTNKFRNNNIFGYIFFSHAIICPTFAPICRLDSHFWPITKRSGLPGNRLIRSFGKYVTLTVVSERNGHQSACSTGKTKARRPSMGLS